MRAFHLGSWAGLLAGGWLLLALVAASPNEAAGKRPSQARLEDFSATVDGQQLLLSFRLVNAFDDNLKRRLESGLATGIVFDFELLRRRRFWLNKTLAQGQLQVSAMYNAVSREYLVNFKHDGALIESRVLRDPAALYAAMARIDELPVFTLGSWRGEAVVRARAELGTGSLLFFIPTLRTTDWVEEKIRIGAPGDGG